MAVENLYCAPWIFIIDTNQYAGNFERQMCAYCTGHIGECGVGDEFIDDKIASIFEDSVDCYVIDDHGCGRPTSIWPTGDPERKERKPDHNSVAIFFYERPTPKQIDTMKTRAKEFAQNRPDEEGKSWVKEKHPMEIKGFHLVYQHVKTVSLNYWDTPE